MGVYVDENGNLQDDGMDNYGGGTSDVPAGGSGVPDIPSLPIDWSTLPAGPENPGTPSYNFYTGVDQQAPLPSTDIGNGYLPAIPGTSGGSYPPSSQNPGGSNPITDFLKGITGANGPGSGASNAGSAAAGILGDILKSLFDPNKRKSFGDVPAMLNPQMKNMTGTIAQLNERAQTPVQIRTPKGLLNRYEPGGN